MYIPAPNYSRTTLLGVRITSNTFITISSSRGILHTTTNKLTALVLIQITMRIYTWQMQGFSK